MTLPEPRFASLLRLDQSRVIMPDITHLFADSMPSEVFGRATAIAYELCGALR